MKYAPILLLLALAGCFDADDFADERMTPARMEVAKAACAPQGGLKDASALVWVKSKKGKIAARCNNGSWITVPYGSAE